MVNLDQLVDHWGYPAVFAVVLLGNLGVPIPEESVLVLAGYLVWRSQLDLTLVILIGVCSACAGDNLGYYFGKRYGPPAIVRYGKRLLITPTRLNSMQRLMQQYGALSVFTARFLPGFRFAAGPLAGALGMTYRSFLSANLLGAIVYIPIAVGVGYGIGLGFGAYIERLARTIGKIEHLVLFTIAAAAFVVLLYRIGSYGIFRAHRRRLLSRQSKYGPR